MPTQDRASPSGPLASIKNTMAIAATPIALTAVATQTGTFGGALVGDIVSVSPRANLTASVGITFARVVTNGVIVVGFSNIGASTTQAAVTMDTFVQRR